MVPTIPNHLIRKSIIHSIKFAIVLALLAGCDAKSPTVGLPQSAVAILPLLGKSELVIARRFGVPSREWLLIESTRTKASGKRPAFHNKIAIIPNTTIDGVRPKQVIGYFYNDQLYHVIVDFDNGIQNNELTTYSATSHKSELLEAHVGNADIKWTDSGSSASVQATDVTVDGQLREWIERFS